jgi:hypothetical protein
LPMSPSPWRPRRQPPTRCNRIRLSAPSNWVPGVIGLCALRTAPFLPSWRGAFFGPVITSQRRNAETPSTCWSSTARACGQPRIGLGHWECPYEPDYRSGLVVEKEPAAGSSPCTIRGPKLVKFVTRVFIAVPRHPATRAMLYTLSDNSFWRIGIQVIGASAAGFSPPSLPW